MLQLYHQIPFNPYMIDVCNKCYLRTRRERKMKIFSSKRKIVNHLWKTSFFFALVTVKCSTDQIYVRISVKKFIWNCNNAKQSDIATFTFGYGYFHKNFLRFLINFLDKSLWVAVSKRLVENSFYFIIFYHQLYS